MLPHGFVLQFVRYACGRLRAAGEANDEDFSIRLDHDCGANTDPRTLAVAQHRLRANSSASATSCLRSQVRCRRARGDPAARPSKFVPPRGIYSVAWRSISIRDFLGRCFHPAGTRLSPHAAQNTRSFASPCLTACAFFTTLSPRTLDGIRIQRPSQQTGRRRWSNFVI